MTINFSPLVGVTYRWRVIIFSGILVCVATTYISVYSYEIRSFDVVQDSHSYHNKIERYQVWRISSEVMGVSPPLHSPLILFQPLNLLKSNGPN